MDAWMPLIITFAIVGGCLVTGILFAFSNFALQALADLPDEHGMFAMQRVNDRIQNPLFLALFLGAPLACVLIIVATIGAPSVPGNVLLFTGSLAYLAGPFGITVLFNVPLNNRLARATPEHAEAAWPSYRAPWQRWNHIRTYLGILAAALLTLGATA